MSNTTTTEKKSVLRHGLVPRVLSRLRRTATRLDELFTSLRTHGGRPDFGDARGEVALAVDAARLADALAAGLGFTND